MTKDHPKLLWQADTTHPDLAEAARKALRQVMDPEIGLSLVELGLVRDLIIESEQAHLKMMMTTPFCPYWPHLLEMARQKAESALKRLTTVEFLMEPWDPTMMEEGAGMSWGLF